MKLLFSLLIIYIATTTTACASEDIVVADDSENGNLIFYNGTFLTMKEEGSKIKNDSAALMIANGKIVGFESLKDAIIDANDPKYGGGFKYVDLNHKTLMPGFIEPHAHLMLTANGEAVTNLMPCLPDKYQAIYEKDYPETKKCKNFINEALGKLADEQKLVNGWYIGNGLDPSRMLLDDQKSSKETWININRQFLDQPAHFIQHFNSVTQTFDTNLKKKEEGGKYPFDKEAPLFILDQSGHLAYVNEIAFQKAGICSFSSEEVLDKDDKVICIGTKVQMNKSLELAQKEYKFKDGAWGITCEKDRDVCYFSGLLNEESAYQPFIKAIGTPSVRSILKHARQNDLALGVEKRMTELMQIFSRQGVTTFVEGGGSSEEMIKAYKNMVKANTMAARLRILYAWDIKNTAPEKIPFDSDEFKGFLSAEGIKLWADGSTQGCSADLITDYSNLGLCADFKKGHQNYNAAQIQKNLEGFYKMGWYLNVHANGDKAITNTVTAFQNLGETYPEYKTTPLTLIHSTVYDDKQKDDTITAIKKAQKIVPNLSVSHLIGHVAYWGKSLENELGYERGHHIVPARSEWEAGIDVSLHSDMSITPLYPLWFVEQAVTRKTWKYPELSGNGKRIGPVVSQEYCMKNDECLTPYRALMAVTAIPAKQHKLDELGTIEKHKIADFVVLDGDPTTEDVDKIHSIQVICTFINGRKVKVEAATSQVGCELNKMVPTNY